MNLRYFFLRSHLYKGLEQEFGRVYTLILRVRAHFAFSRYLRQRGPRKLQIGAGPTKCAGWMVTDINATLRSETVFLDATKRFPLPDASFDYVFSEHMIEHIPYPAACAMLKECFRIMKPGARIRIATPDLDRFLSLTTSAPNEEQSAYIAWVTKCIMPADTPEQAIFVINNQFRNYGHQFIFDEPCLRDALNKANFVDIRRMAVGESDDTNLRLIEKHGINVGNEAMNAFETMVLEARSG